MSDGQEAEPERYAELHLHSDGTATLDGGPHRARGGEWITSDVILSLEDCR